MKIRRMLLVLAAALAVVLGFSLSGGAFAQSQESAVKVAKVAKSRKPHRNRGPRFDVIEVQNGEVGDIDRKVHITITPLSRSGKQLRSKRSEQVTITLPGGGVFSWERASFGRLYGVDVDELPSGSRLLHELHINVRGFEGRILKFAGITKPVDPRIEQVAQLQSDLAALQAQLANAGEQSEALQQQIMLLLARIADLEAQLAGGTPVTGPVITRNPAFVNPVYIPGAINVRWASFVVTVPVGQHLTFSSPVADKDLAPGLKLQNMYTRVTDTVGTKNSSPRAVIGDEEANLAFSTSPSDVAGGGSAIIDYYGDILTTSTPGTYASAIDLRGLQMVDGNGAAVPFPGEVAGQDLRIVDGPVQTLATGIGTAPSKTLVMGSTGNSLMTFRLTADSTDDLLNKNIVVTDTFTGSGMTSFSGLYVWKGNTQVFGPLSLVSVDATHAAASFSLATIAQSGVVNPKNSSFELEVRGDMTSFDAGSQSGATHRFSVSADGVTVVAVGSPTATVTVVGSATGNLMKVARTKINLVSSVWSTPVNNAVRSSFDDRATMTLSADSAYQARQDDLTLTFRGGAVPSSISAFTVNLIDTATGVSWGSSVQTTASWSAAKNGWVATFYPQYTISEGASKSFKVRINSSGFNNAAGSTDSFAITIDSGGDLTCFDGTVTLPSDATSFPYQVFTGSYE